MNKYKIKIAYISGPYRSDTKTGVQKNIATAERYAKKYWRKGFAVICPHMNSAHMDGVVSDKSFLEGDLEFIRRFKKGDIIAMLPDWEYSTGSVGEHDLAKELGLEIVYE